MSLLRSMLFTVILFASVVPASIFIVLARLFGYRASYWANSLWTRFVVWLCRVICGLDYSVEGQDNIPDRASVVFMKHSSTYETIVQVVMFPRQTWVLKRELMWAPFVGWALLPLRAIAINRGAHRAAVQQVIDQGKQRLADGTWVMIFPEGTRMQPGHSRPYGISGTLLAQEFGCLLVPVAHNAGDFWPRRGLRKRSGTVQFCVGPPVDPSGRNPREVNAELQNWVETKVAEIRRASGHE
jgi:1-acyl-sn-glycerol-3-phosphate acyltransferase